MNQWWAILAISGPVLRRCARCRSIAYCSQECQATSWAEHKSSCKRPNYIIKFHIHPDDIKDPPVTRTLSCPADADFYTLHLALQLAFGWATTHSFDFAVLNPDYDISSDVMAVMHNMQGLMEQGRTENLALEMPEYFFRITDPDPETEFTGIDRMHERHRRHPHTQEKRAHTYKLYQLFDGARWRGNTFVYTYDFGDNWEHYLTVEGRADPTEGFQVLSGTRHSVAEDVGGLKGWEELKAAYRARNPTSEQREHRDWFENVASNEDPQGLGGDRVSRFEGKDAINRRMRSLGSS